MPFSRRLAFTMAADAGVALGIVALRRWTWEERTAGLVAGGFIVSMVYAASVGTLSNLTLPYLSPHVASRSRRTSWFLLSGILLVLTLVGCVFSVAILVEMEVFPEGRFWGLVYSSMIVAGPISFVIGFSRYIYEGVRSSLDETTMELAAKELEEERARKLAIEARLSSLESRVHPHFLFNTLNSISSLIQEDPALAERMVERLSALLRFSLDSNQRSTVPLSQEIKIVVDYLEIEKARFGERLHYSIDVPVELESVQVPPLSVQTLVENGVKHGLSKRRNGGRIRVAARIENRRVNIEVRDDGPGFTPEAITSGHGLDNVQARLAALFDDDASLSISAAEGETVVTVSLPRASELLTTTV